MITIDEECLCQWRLLDSLDCHLIVGQEWIDVSCAWKEMWYKHIERSGEGWSMNQIRFLLQRTWSEIHNLIPSLSLVYLHVFTDGNFLCQKPHVYKHDTHCLITKDPSMGVWVTLFYLFESLTGRMLSFVKLLSFIDFTHTFLLRGNIFHEYDTDQLSINQLLFEQRKIKSNSVLMRFVQSGENHLKPSRASKAWQWPGKTSLSEENSSRSALQTALICFDWLG